MTNKPTDYDRFLAHQKRTIGRIDRLGNPIEFKLSFDEWAAIWNESGQSANRGTRRGQYCMARRDDIGHYEIGNVFIQLSSENFRDAARRGHPSTNKGKTQSTETKEKISNAMKVIRKMKKWSTSVKDGVDGRRKPMSEERKAHLRKCNRDRHTSNN